MMKFSLTLICSFIEQTICKRGLSVDNRKIVDDTHTDKFHGHENMVKVVISEEKWTLGAVKRNYHISIR